jgi:hypothetical protein
MGENQVLVLNKPYNSAEKLNFQLTNSMAIVLTFDQKKLANFMSQISECCYHAAWMENLEYVLWHALENGPQEYGHGSISEEDIYQLKQLSNQAQCWIYFDDETEETAVSLDEWRNGYKKNFPKT